jgi:hypothetical protein
MEEKDEWVFFKDIDWNCPKNNRFNVDTRDFHCGYNFTKDKHVDYYKLCNYVERFFYTEDELKSIIERLYTESGGERKWRLLDLDSDHNTVCGWALKYLRVWRTEKGFIICNTDNKAIPKEVLSSKVKKEY